MPSRARSGRANFAAAFKDNYSAALKDLVKRKMKGKTTHVSVDEEERPSRGGDNVADLKSALRKSLESSGKRPPAKPASPARRRKSA